MKPGEALPKQESVSDNQTLLQQDSFAAGRQQEESTRLAGDTAPLQVKFSQLSNIIRFVGNPSLLKSSFSYYDAILAHNFED